jgi:lipid A 3-O-deacylase
MRGLLFRALMLAANLAWPGIAVAAESANRPTFSLVTENDSYISISGDRHYTNGIYFSWTSQAQPETRSFARHLMLPGTGEWRSGFFLGQAIFTPENLTAFTPPANDRPYAGWLFGGARLYRDGGTVLDKIEVTLGVVGPAALGSDVQKAWHAAFVPSAAHPNGWHAQLRDEPGLVLSSQRIWRVTLKRKGLEAELLPEANLSAGNVYAYAGAGAMLRLGRNLAADWGPPRIAPAQQGSDFQTVDRFAWYIFAGGEARALARNLFLDGNSFDAGPTVAKQTIVGDINGGAALLFPHARLIASYTRRSAEFRGQKGADQLGSLTVSFIP